MRNQFVDCFCCAGDRRRCIASGVGSADERGGLCRPRRSRSPRREADAPSRRVAKPMRPSNRARAPNRKPKPTPKRPRRRCGSATTPSCRPGTPWPRLSSSFARVRSGSRSRCRRSARAGPRRMPRSSASLPLADAVALCHSRRHTEAALQMTNWVIASEDNGGLPFIVIDKVAAAVFVFDPQGQIPGRNAGLAGDRDRG